MNRECEGCDISLIKLCKFEESQDDVINLCVNHNIILKECNCEKCDNICQLDYGKETFECQKVSVIYYPSFVTINANAGRDKSKLKKVCNFKQSIYKNTFFSNANIPPIKVLQLIRSLLYGYSGLNNIVIKHNIRVPDATIVEWKKQCREVFINYVKNDFATSGQIGGDTKTVEIDQTIFGQRKYNVGGRAFYRDIKIFGSIERGSARIYLEEAGNGDEETLLALTKKYIKPGTLIVTSSASTYNYLSDHNYKHQIISSCKFVDPKNQENTQLIRNMWKQVKRLKREGSRKHYIKGYLASFMFMHNIKQVGERFHKFLLEAGRLYDPRKYSKLDC